MTLTKIPCNQDINNDERQGQDCKNSSNRHGYEDLHLSAFYNENGLKNNRGEIFCNCLKNLHMSSYSNHCLEIKNKIIYSIGESPTVVTEQTTQLPL